MTELNVNGGCSSILLLSSSVAPSHPSTGADAEVEWDVPRYTSSREAAGNSCFTLLHRACSWLWLWWSRTFRYCSRWLGRSQAGEQGQPLLEDTTELVDPRGEPEKAGIDSRAIGFSAARKWWNQSKQKQDEKVFLLQRGYAPPRSRSKESYFSRMNAPKVSQRRVAPGDSENESFRLHSDEESSTSLRLHSGVSFKERWIMQHGVLVSVGPDGPLDKATNSMVWRLANVGGAYVHRQRGGYQPERQDAYEEGGEANSIPRPSPSMDDVETVLAELETHRQPIHTLEQLTAFLTRCADLLPLHVEVECEGTTSPQDTINGTERDVPSTLEYGLHFIGPLKPNSYTAVLSILEDVIMDDCDSNVIRLATIHCSDLCFSSHLLVLEKNLGRLGTSDVIGDKALPSGDWQIKSDLDDMMPSHYSPQKQQQFTNPLDEANGKSGGCQLTRSAEPWLYRAPPTPSVLQDSIELLKECHMRLLGILKNIMDNMNNTIHSVWLTRCVFAPMDIGQSLPLTLSPLVELIFEQCPLSPAHIDALLQLARTETRRHAASAFAGAHPPVALSRLTKLQLSGTLTEECISELLSYLWDEVVGEKGTALRALRLPSLLVRVAKGHPFIQAHPYVQVFPLA